MTSLLYRLRYLFLKPDSKLELWLRSAFHKIQSSRYHFRRQAARAQHTYRRNRSCRWPKVDAELRSGPVVLFIMTVLEGQRDLAADTLESLKAQTLANWRVVILGEELGDDVFSVGEASTRITVQPRAALGEMDWESVNEGFIVVCEPGDHFAPDLMHCFSEAWAGAPGKAVYFYDCEYADQASSRTWPLLKPPTVTVDPLLSVNLLSRSFFKADIFIGAIKDLDPHWDLRAWEYALSLQMAEKPEALAHIPNVLAFQATLPQPTDPQLWPVVRAWLEQKGLEQPDCSCEFSEPHVAWRITDPGVSIVIPTKNHKTLLEPLLDTIRRTDYSNYRVLLVDNGSTDPETLSFYQGLKGEPRVVIVPYDEPFNYSKAINTGASQTDSELILLLNDDMEVIEPGWLRELSRWAMRPEVGVVGAKLIRRNHTLQHAGIVVGLNAFAGHLYLDAEEHYHGLAGSVNWVRNFLALTGACQMVRRSVFEKAGGYDEGFRLAFGDIDFCLKVHDLGYRNVYTPFANLYHLEGQSRGYTTPVADINRGYTVLGPALLQPDLYFPERLSLTRIPYYLPRPVSEEERLSAIEERQKFYLKG